MLKLEGDTSLIDHFARFESLVEELAATGVKFEEIEQCAYSLVSLPNTYNGVVTAIETLAENKICLNYVKTRLLDQEIKLNEESRDTSSKVLNAEFKQSFSNVGHNKQSKFYANHKQKFKKGNKNNWIKVNKNKNSNKCHHCGRIGHIQRDCYYHKRYIEYEKNRRSAQVAKTIEQTTNFTSSFAFMTNNFDDQISDACKNKNEIYFVLDSGLSEHLINDDNLFESSIHLDNPLKISTAKKNVYIEAFKQGII